MCRSTLYLVLIETLLFFYYTLAVAADLINTDDIVVVVVVVNLRLLFAFICLEFSLLCGNRDQLLIRDLLRIGDVVLWLA